MLIVPHNPVDRAPLASVAGRAAIGSLCSDRYCLCADVHGPQNIEKHNMSRIPDTLHTADGCTVCLCSAALLLSKEPRLPELSCDSPLQTLSALCVFMLPRPSTISDIQLTYQPPPPLLETHRYVALEMVFVIL